jgi:hypothetical protein
MLHPEQEKVPREKVNFRFAQLYQASLIFSFPVDQMTISYLSIASLILSACSSCPADLTLVEKVA